MATNTYVAIDKVTVTSAVPTVTFSSITQNYTDLVLVIDGTPVTAGSYNLEMRFNSDTGSNYSRTQISGDGTIADSSRASNQTKLILTYNASLASTKSNQIINILNYSNTTTFKTVLARANRASSGTDFIVNLYRSTLAITSIDIFLTGSNLQTGSTFSLYGIAAEGAPYATGGLITSDSNYYYHTFTSSGTFTPLQTLSCDVLSVGGGGGGGWNNAGGGGGGEVDILSALSVSVNKTVTIGGGGARATSTASAGANGVTTTFAGDTSSLGGGGGGTGDASAPNQAGQTGGSGGGGALSSVGGAASGSNTNIGGTGYASGASGGQYSGGGGGGATAVGGNANLGTTTSGAGGQGYALGNIFSGLVLSSITHFGSGGSGGVFNGTRALGGTNAGNGAQDSGTDISATTPTANAGGGGGGGAYIGIDSRQGSAGGSGIVIVRYEK